MKNYKIYTLNDPITNEVKYVGQTCKDLNKRLSGHLSESRLRCKSHKNHWIKSLQQKDLKPTINLILDNLTKEEANNKEIEYISFFKKEYNLTNSTKGGEGSINYKHSEEVKEKLSIIASERFKNPKAKEQLSLTMKNKRINLSNEDKINEIIKQPKSKKIYQYTINNEYINEFNSLREIERELGYFRANISPCLQGKFKQAYGFHWSYQLL